MDSQLNKPDNNKLKPGRVSPVVLVIVLVAAALVAVLAYNAFKPSSRGPNSSTSVNTTDMPIAGASGLYLSPKSGSYSSGANFTIQIRENSSQTLVNAVQANLAYPTDLLKVVKVDASSSKFKVEAQNQSGGGQITLARGSTSPILGDQLVAQVTFQGIATGAARVTFVSGSALVNASTNKSILKGLPEPFTYTIR
jgi:hypothetical protein